MVLSHLLKEYKIKRWNPRYSSNLSTKRSCYFAFGLLQFSRAKSTGCAACDTLQSLWSPDDNSGSCLTDIHDLVKYIVNFQQCICSPQSQSDYEECVKCNIDSDVGTPIDGLNFGPAKIFSSACSVFSDDVTSVWFQVGFLHLSKQLHLILRRWRDNLQIGIFWRWKYFEAFLRERWME